MVLLFPGALEGRTLVVQLYVVVVADTVVEASHSWLKQTTTPSSRNGLVCWFITTLSIILAQQHTHTLVRTQPHTIARTHTHMHTKHATLAHWNPPRGGRATMHC